MTRTKRRVRKRKNEASASDSGNDIIDDVSEREEIGQVKEYPRESQGGTCGYVCVGATVHPIAAGHQARSKLANDLRGRDVRAIPICRNEGRAKTSTRETGLEVEFPRMGVDGASTPPSSASQLFGDDPIFCPDKRAYTIPRGNSPPLNKKSFRRAGLSRCLRLLLDIHPHRSKGESQNNVHGVGSSPTGNLSKKETSPPDLHQPRQTGEWISVRSEMDLYSLEGWDYLCKCYDAEISLLVYPVALEDRQDPFILLRQRGKRGRLLVASLEEHELFHLGEGPYIDQLRILKTRQFIHDHKFLLFPETFKSMFGFVSAGTQTNH
jgi:hypothetical protein